MPAELFVERVTVDAAAARELPPWIREIDSLAPLLAGEPITLTAPIVFVVGENGSGKSTLIEAIVEQFGIDSRGGRAAVLGGNLDTEKTPLAGALRLGLSRRGDAMRRGRRQGRHGFFLRAETVLEMNDRFSGVRGYWDRDVSTQSHGEGFFQIIESMLIEPGFYVMDEPESALSFHSCLRLMGLLDQLRASGSQIICATHSPVLAAVPGAQIIEMLPTGPTNTDWESLALVDHWRRFLDAPESYLRGLVPDYTRWARLAEHPDDDPATAVDDVELIKRVRARIYGHD